jgi:hypothetical protein
LPLALHLFQGLHVAARTEPGNGKRVRPVGSTAQALLLSTVSTPFPL